VKSESDHISYEGEERGVMEKSASASVCSAKKRKANLVVSPCFPQHPQLTHGNKIVISTQERNKRPRLPKLKPKAEAKPTVTAEEKVLSLYFRENNQGEDGITIISSNNKAKTKAKAQNKKRVVFSYFSHENNDIVVVSKARVKVSLRFQPQQGQSLSTVNKQQGDNGSLGIKRRASMKYARKNEKKKSVIDAYMRKYQENTWIPPTSVHVLLPKEYSKDIWEVLIPCILLNKTPETQVKEEEREGKERRERRDGSGCG
jgi:hypothetical protein